MAKEVHQLSLFPLGAKEQPVTCANLERFGKVWKEDLLKELAIMLCNQPKLSLQKWLKNKAAAALLGVSLRTLQASYQITSN